MRFWFHICQQVSKNSVTKSNIIKSELLNEEAQSLLTRMKNLIRHINTQLFCSIISLPNINGKNLSHVAHLTYQVVPYCGDRWNLIAPPPGKISLQETPSPPKKFLFSFHQKLTHQHSSLPRPPHPQLPQLNKHFQVIFDFN